MVQKYFHTYFYNMTFIIFHISYFIFVFYLGVTLSGRAFCYIFFKASLRYLLPKNILVSIVSKKDAASIHNAYIRQIQFQFHFNFLPIILVQIVVNTTMLIELKGINIAATTGANCPVTAK